MLHLLHAFRHERIVFMLLLFHIHSVLCLKTALIIGRNELSVPCVIIQLSDFCMPAQPSVTASA